MKFFSFSLPLSIHISCTLSFPKSHSFSFSPLIFIYLYLSCLLSIFIRLSFLSPSFPSILFYLSLYWPISPFCTLTFPKYHFLYPSLLISRPSLSSLFLLLSFFSLSLRILFLLSFSLRWTCKSPLKSQASSPRELKTLVMCSLWAPTKWHSAVTDRDGPYTKTKNRGRTRWARYSVILYFHIGTPNRSLPTWQRHSLSIVC